MGARGWLLPLGVLGFRGHSSVITNYQLGELRIHQLVTETLAITTNAGATCSHRKSHKKWGCFLIEISKVHLPDATIRQKEISGIKGALEAPYAKNNKKAPKLV